MSHDNLPFLSSLDKRSLRIKNAVVPAEYKKSYANFANIYLFEPEIINWPLDSFEGGGGGDRLPSNKSRTPRSLGLEQSV
jgi:hypothetical protein